MPNCNACMYCAYYDGKCCNFIQGHSKSMNPVDVCVQFKFKLYSAPIDPNIGRGG